MSNVSATPSSLPAPQQAKNNASFFLKVNEAIQWEKGADTFLLQVQSITGDRALLSLYISGNSTRFFVKKGSALNLDVTGDTKADGSITLMNIEGDRAELRMVSFAELEANPQPKVNVSTTQTPGQQNSPVQAVQARAQEKNNASTLYGAGVIIIVLIVLVIAWIVWRRRPTA